MTLRDVRVARKPADRAVHHIDLVLVEQLADRRAPAPKSVGALAMPVAHGRVANQNQRRQLRVRGPRQAKILLPRLRVLRPWSRSRSIGRVRRWRWLLRGE